MLYANVPCPRDGLYGRLEFHYCPKSEKVFLMCDECISIWTDPNDLDLEIDWPYTDTDNPFGGEFQYNRVIAEVGCSINEAREATEDEIVKYGWTIYIRKDI